MPLGKVKHGLPSWELSLVLLLVSLAVCKYTVQKSKLLYANNFIFFMVYLFIWFLCVALVALELAL